MTSTTSNEQTKRAQEREIHTERMATLHENEQTKRTIAGVVTVGVMVVLATLLVFSNACGIRRDAVRTVCLENHTAIECVLIECEYYSADHPPAECAASYVVEGVAPRHEGPQ